MGCKVQTIAHMLCASVCTKKPRSLVLQGFLYILRLLLFTHADGLLFAAAEMDRFDEIHAAG